MLRVLLLVVLVANLLFFGFTRGWFDGLFGLQSLGDREPERIANQVRPASIVLMPVASAPPGTSGSSGDGELLLRTPEGIVPIGSGEVSVRPIPDPQPRASAPC